MQKMAGGGGKDSVFPELSVDALPLQLKYALQSLDQVSVQSLAPPTSLPHLHVLSSR